MGEGPEHASKVETGTLPKLTFYNFLQDKHLMVSNVDQVGPNLTLADGRYTAIDRLEVSDQSPSKFELFRRFRTSVIGMTPKRSYDTKQRNAGLPKASNCYGNGVFNSSTNL